MNFTFIVTLVSITGTIANIYKKRWCFIIWLFTNAFWCIYDLTLGLYSQAVLFAVYFVLAVIGLCKWKIEKFKPKIKLETEWERECKWCVHKKNFYHDEPCYSCTNPDEQKAIDGFEVDKRMVMKNETL